MKSAAAAGIDNTTRKKWDKQEYKEKALQRVNAEEGDKQKNDRNNKLKASDFGLVVKQPLSRENMIERDFKRDLLSKVGTVTLVNPVTKEGSGFMCKETGVILHDSISYLDHINSKKTQRERGISIHAERSTVEQVRNRFQMHKKRKEQIKRGEKPDGEEETDLVKRIEHATNKEREEQEERKERKRLKKEQKKLGMNKEEVEKTLEEDEMMKAMGFSGFQ